MDTIVVTGHPRSGTSMMMRMLHKGGMTIVADEESLKSQEQNKYGTFEILNYGWLVQNPHVISGSAVKIVTQYIHVLEGLIIETDLSLKVIFMLRPISDIETSLQEMGQRWDPPPRDSVALARKVIEHHQIPVLFIEYLEGLKYPVATCQRVADFVSQDLDLEKMISAIDPKECHHGQT